jgi:serine/threonine protein kinase
MIQTPDTFGAYALERRIAVGGMAEIYKATTRVAGGGERVVAIKRLHKHMSDDPELAQMLVDEARLAVQLQHPNIGQVFDLGSLDGHYFIVMEFIDGVDLMQVLRQCKEKGWRVPPALATWLMIETLDALEFAHSAVDANGRPLNVVHRDVSPQNVMVTYGGDVKLVDFGIAKAEAQVMQTQAGIIKGKFYYMSPEQAFGHKLDRRSDVFAAGMVLYELLTGRPAYDEANDFELIRKVRQAEFPAASYYQHDIDPTLERILMAALARDRNRRIASCKEFADELRAYARATYDPISRIDVGAYVSDLFGKPRPEARAGRTMRRDEFVSNDSSVIFKVSADALSDLAPTNPEQGGGHFAESAFLGDDEAFPHDATSVINPFEVDEPTTLFNRDDLDDPGLFDVSEGDDTSGWSMPRSRGPAPVDASMDATNVATASSMARAGASVDAAPSFSDEGNPFAIPDTLSVPEVRAQDALVSSRPNAFALPPSPRATPSAFPDDGVLPAPPGFGPSPAAIASSKAAFTPPPERTAMMGLGPVLERIGLERMAAQRQKVLVAAIAAAVVFGGLIAVIVISALGGDPPAEGDGEYFVPEEAAAPEPEAPPEPEAAPPAPTEATLELASTPSNARVYLDDASVGTTPLALPDLEVGRAYVVRLELDGRETWSQSITVAAQNDPLEITLAERVAGVLQVVTEPAGLKVDLDGKPAGESPVTVTDLDRGTNHFVVVHKPSGQIHQEVVTWEQDEEPAKTINIRIADATDAALPEATPVTEEEKPKKKKRKKRRRKKRKKKKTSGLLDPFAGTKSKSKKLDPWNP